MSTMHGMPSHFQAAAVELANEGKDLWPDTWPKKALPQIWCWSASGTAYRWAWRARALVLPSDLTPVYRGKETRVRMQESPSRFPSVGPGWSHRAQELNFLLHLFAPMALQSMLLTILRLLSAPRCLQLSCDTAVDQCLQTDRVLTTVSWVLCIGSHSPTRIPTKTEMHCHHKPSQR